MSENKNKIAAGKAMIRLNEMAAALSFNPTLLICFKKKLATSYTGIPLKPGITQRLLFCKRKDTGGNLSMMRSSFVKAWGRFVVF